MVRTISRIACVHLPALALESVYRRLSPDECRPRRRKNQKDAQERLQTRVCGVRTEVRGRKVLIDVSDAARSKRIYTGMTQTEARARDPKIGLRDRDPTKELERLSVAAELLFAFGPTVELCPPSFLFVEIGQSKSALRRKLEDSTDQTIARAIVRTLTHAGHRCRVVVTRDPDTGRSILEHLARVRAQKSVVVVPPREEVRYLSRLPLSALTWTDADRDPEGKMRESLLQTQASLAMLGVCDTHRLQQLPAEQIGSRFGEAGVRMMKRAKAELMRPLRTFVPSERLQEELELDRPTDDLEPLLFLLKRMFDRLEARLDARALSVCALEMTFLVEPGLENKIDADQPRPRSSKRRETVQVQFARATRRASTMLKIAREKLNGARIGRVQAITLEARSPEVDHGAQLDLFTNRERKVEEVSELIGRLVAALGDTAVFSPAIVDTHRPESAWDKQPFSVERALRDPPTVRPPQEEEEASLAVIATHRSSDRALPKVTSALSVTQASASCVAETTPDDRAPWPKPIPRKPEDEPIPELPPRPLELLTIPEPAMIDGSVLRWRGQRIPVSAMRGGERLECEWWTPSPVARDYVVAEASDGRRFWLFTEPDGKCFLHGIFD